MFPPPSNLCNGPGVVAVVLNVATWVQVNHSSALASRRRTLQVHHHVVSHQIHSRQLRRGIGWLRNLGIFEGRSLKRTLVLDNFMWSRVRNQVRRWHDALLSILMAYDGVISISLNQFDKITQRFSLVSQKTSQKHSTWREQPRGKNCTEHGFAKKTKQTLMTWGFHSSSERHTRERSAFKASKQIPSFLRASVTKTWSFSIRFDSRIHTGWKQFLSLWENCVSLG